MRAFLAGLGKIALWCLFALVVWFLWETFVSHWSLEARILTGCLLFAYGLNWELQGLKEKMDAVSWRLQDIESRLSGTYYDRHSD